MYFLVVVILRYILVSAKHSGCCKQIPNTTTYKYKKIYSFKPCNKFYYFEFSNEYYAMSKIHSYRLLFRRFCYRSDI